LDRLCGTDQPAGAAPHRLALLPHGMAVAGRAAVREDVGHGIPGAFFRQYVEYLGDDIAGALHDDGVADTDVAALSDRLALVAYALDVVLVVERRIDDGHAADRHRLQPRHRRQRAGATDLDVDRGQHRRRLLGGELVRGRPAGAARTET